MNMYPGPIFNRYFVELWPMFSVDSLHLEQECLLFAQYTYTLKMVFNF